MRTHYGVVRTTCMELAWIISTNVGSAFPPKARICSPSQLTRRRVPAPSGGTLRRRQELGGAEAAEHAHGRELVALMVRYINLGHLLLLMELQKAERGDFAECAPPPAPTLSRTALEQSLGARTSAGAEQQKGLFPRLGAQSPRPCFPLRARREQSTSKQPGVF